MTEQALDFPIRRHPDCDRDHCVDCLKDHEALAVYIESKISPGRDWLCEYRLWMDNNGIPAEVNGWASREAFDPQNINEFINFTLCGETKKLGS